MQDGRCLQPQVEQLSSPNRTSPKPDQAQNSDKKTTSNGEGLLTEQSLDEYSHNFLKQDALRKRDESQVVGRYAKHRKPGLDEIVVVSQLWIWKFGGLLFLLFAHWNFLRCFDQDLTHLYSDFFISSYGDDRDPSPSSEQCEHLSHTIFKGDCSFPNTTTGALHAIMEACVRYEPRFPRREGRELLDGAGAFADEIAHEVSQAF